MKLWSVSGAGMLQFHCDLSPAAQLFCLLPSRAEFVQIPGVTGSTPILGEIKKKKTSLDKVLESTACLTTLSVSSH